MTTPTSSTAPASPAPAAPSSVSSAQTSLAPVVRSWPLLLLAAPAFVAVWSGWVGLGRLTGFGDVQPLPGIVDGLVLDTAITLPIGVETYAAFALRVWLSPRVPARARAFARWSALGALALGAAGQVAYHLMTAAGITRAPWQITAAVACLPVAVLGMGAALAHLVRDHTPTHTSGTTDTTNTAGDTMAAGGALVEVAPVELEAVDLEARPVVSLAGEAFTAAGSSTARPAPTAPRAPRTDRPTPRGTGRTAAGLDTGARVAGLRERHPDMTTAEIARRLGVTDRTVRRYLAASTADTDHPSRPTGDRTGERTGERTEDAA